MNEAMVPVFEAARQIGRYLPPTPLVRSALLSKHFDRDVWLKLESESPVGSFKARGALRCLSERVKEGYRNFATASTGNHGMAVAFAGHLLGLATHIFLPRDAVSRKIRLVREYTSNVVLTDCDFDAAKEMAREFAGSRDCYFIDDGHEETIVHGTGTIGLEILMEMTPDLIVVPVGNGALISGIGQVVKHLAPATRVAGVQPAQAATMYLSWKAGRPVQLESISTIADGLASRVAVPSAVERMSRVVDEMVLVTDQQILDAVRLFQDTEARIIEPSSAAAVAALSLPELRASSVVVIVTGRNYEPV
jgi:threonine dehydratase